MGWPFCRLLKRLVIPRDCVEDVDIEGSEAFLLGCLGVSCCCCLLTKLWEKV